MAELTPQDVTPFSICTCTRCGPPWRDSRPAPAEDDWSGQLAWSSWMPLCPQCGNKRCPGANNHENACSGSNEPGQGSFAPS